MLNSNGQASFEFLLVIVVVILLVVIIFAYAPLDSKEIVSLGIAKNITDEFVLKENYTGKYTIDSKISSDSSSIDLNLFFESVYDKTVFSAYADKIKKEVQKSTDFNTIMVYYN